MRQLRHACIDLHMIVDESDFSCMAKSVHSRSSPPPSVSQRYIHWIHILSLYLCSFEFYGYEAQWLTQGSYVPIGASSRRLAKRKANTHAKIVSLLWLVHSWTATLSTDKSLSWHRCLQYCGPICQTSHWSRHKIECKSTLGKKTWQPAWVLENRTPAFIGTGIGETFGAMKYLWGNVPAFDVLELGSNEGEEYTGDLRILFAGI